MLLPKAPPIWGALNGLICVYKPAEMSVRKLRNILISKISKEMNELEVRPPAGYVAIEGKPTEKLTVSVRPNFADHPLVVGPRYQERDLAVSWSNHLGYYTSGVLLFGIKSGTREAKFIRENLPTRAYRVKGVLGLMTDNCFRTGKVMMKSTWKHVRRHNVDGFLSAMQASHQRKMFELCGVDMESQAAYDLAKQGLIRPANAKIPIIYGIKCVEFEGPHFTLEIQCVNEYEDYMTHIINEIGLKLRSVAHCTDIQCIRHSRGINYSGVPLLARPQSCQHERRLLDLTVTDLTFELVGIPASEEIVDEITKDLENTLEINKDCTNPLDAEQKPETNCIPEDFESSDVEAAAASLPDDYVDEDKLKELELTLSDEEKVEQHKKALNFKAEGNEEFKQERYVESIVLYTSGLRICPLELHSDRSVLYANRAAAKAKLDRKLSAIEDCTKAIDLNNAYLKAYLRRAKLYEEADKLEESLADYNKIIELDPGNRDANEAKVRLPPIINEKNEKLKEEMLGKLKDLGNIVLRPFGLSTDNFKLTQDPNTGGYSVNFSQGGK
ncbi:hypothetical protein D910_09417 [Dendroctonus ponderosae]|uniref:Pseudouridine synthase II N-terminal domain-containing protein n=1 Tax=Dendroctonus ponderosae TaxID=77166 RepID=U4UPL4_DENPD|nr:hypothetical protein D910_09417 [Dendroctonus ponderosae]